MSCVQKRFSCLASATPRASMFLHTPHQTNSMTVLWKPHSGGPEHRARAQPLPEHNHCMILHSKSLFWLHTESKKKKKKPAPCCCHHHCSSGNNNNSNNSNNINNNNDTNSNGDVSQQEGPFSSGHDPSKGGGALVTVDTSQLLPPGAGTRCLATFYFSVHTSSLQFRRGNIFPETYKAQFKHETRRCPILAIGDKVNFVWSDRLSLFQN